MLNAETPRSSYLFGPQDIVPCCWVSTCRAIDTYHALLPVLSAVLLRIAHFYAVGRIDTHLDSSPPSCAEHRTPPSCCSFSCHTDHVYHMLPFVCSNLIAFWHPTHVSRLDVATEVAAPLVDIRVHHVLCFLSNSRVQNSATSCYIYIHTQVHIHLGDRPSSCQRHSPCPLSCVACPPHSSCSLPSTFVTYATVTTCEVSRQKTPSHPNATWNLPDPSCCRPPLSSPFKF